MEAPFQVEVVAGQGARLRQALVAEVAAELLVRPWAWEVAAVVQKGRRPVLGCSPPVGAAVEAVRLVLVSRWLPGLEQEAVGVVRRSVSPAPETQMTYCPWRKEGEAVPLYRRE